MAHRPSRKKRHFGVAEHLTLTSLLDMFMNVIPFLIMTGTFASMAIIDVYLPREGVAKEGVKEEKAAAPTQDILAVKVGKSGFELGGIGGGVVIPRVNGSLNLKELNSVLTQIKEKYPLQEEVVLLFETAEPYETIVKVMDASRETSDKKTLFPIVSLGESE